MAVLDCFSRYLLVLQISPVRTTAELIKGLDQALQEARLLSDLPTDRAINLVIDGTGVDTQAFSNYVAGSPFRLGQAEPRTFQSLGSIRRLLWTLKDEEIGVNLYRSPDEAQRSLEMFRRTYNFERPHQALKYKVPADFFCKERTMRRV